MIANRYSQLFGFSDSMGSGTNLFLKQVEQQITGFEVSFDVHASGHEDEAVALVAVEADVLHAGLPPRRGLLVSGQHLRVVLDDGAGSFVEEAHTCQKIISFGCLPKLLQ